MGVNKDGGKHDYRSEANTDLFTNIHHKTDGMKTRTHARTHAHIHTHTHTR